MKHTPEAIHVAEDGSGTGTKTVGSLHPCKAEFMTSAGLTW